jgi:DNA mismatch repair protein MutL
LVVDQQRAHEQILYEHYKSVKDSNSTTACQQILFPITIEVTPNDFILINSLNDYFVVLGFEIEAFGKNTMIVRGTPAELGEFNIQEMI